MRIWLELEEQSAHRARGPPSTGRVFDGTLYGARRLPTPSFHRSRFLRSATASMWAGEVKTVPNRINWRRGWDSNPRGTCTPTRFPGVPDRPLQHLSARGQEGW